MRSCQTSMPNRPRRQHAEACMWLWVAVGSGVATPHHTTRGVHVLHPSSGTAVKSAQKAHTGLKYMMFQIIRSTGTA